MLSCKNADALGVPNKGIHSYRLGGVAAVDLLLTIGVAIGLSYIPKSPPCVIWIIFLLLLGILFHLGFCVETSVHKWLKDSCINMIIFTAILILSAILIPCLNKMEKI